MTKKIFTIGYEGSELEDFLETLKFLEIEVLVDVRDVPLSRKKGFSKNILKDTLEQNGIQYIHLKGLGDPKDGRIAARNGDFDAFRKIFHKHMKSDLAQEDLKEASEMVKKMLSCLLCYERDHKTCHRTIVADYLAEITGQIVQSVGVRKGIARENPSGEMLRIAYA